VIRERGTDRARELVRCRGRAVATACLAGALASTIALAGSAAALGRGAAAQSKLTAHLTARQQGNPSGTTVATRADIVFTLTGRTLAWDGTFQQLSGWPFVVTVVFPGTSANTIALCPHSWPPTMRCRAQQGEQLTAGMTPVSGELLGTIDLSAKQAAAVVGGRGYVVFETRTNPTGEIRGQLKKTNA
jgi:hypothetical protein